jgi:hypothetical protein
MKNLNQERIERYVLQNMEDNERKSFENELEGNAGLQREVRLMKNIVGGMSVAAERQFADTIQSVEESLDQGGFFLATEDRELLEGIRTEGFRQLTDVVKDVSESLDEEGFFGESETKVIPMAQTDKKVRSLWPRLAIAMSLALLITLSWFLFRPAPQSPQQLFASYFAPAADDISSTVADDLAEMGFASDERAALLNIENLMNAYNAGNDSEVLAIYRSLEVNLGQTDYEKQVRFYAAQSLIRSGEAGEALSILQDLLDRPTLDNEDAVRWYAGLANLQLDRPEDALELWDGMDDQSPFYARVEEIRQRLD